MYVCVCVCMCVCVYSSWLIIHQMHLITDYNFPPVYSFCTHTHTHTQTHMGVCVCVFDYIYVCGRGVGGCVFMSVCDSIFIILWYIAVQYKATSETD